MEYLLGIDIGTSGTKTVLFDRDANPITAKTFEYPLYQEQNGWAEQEPADWWNAVVQGVQAVLQASGVDAADIKPLLHETSLDYAKLTFYPGMLLVAQGTLEQARDLLRGVLAQLDGATAAA